MKSFFVTVNYDKKITIPKDVINKLPQKIMLFMTAQLINQQKEMIKFLNENGKTVLLEKPRHTIHVGQILGCDTEIINGDFDAFFYIGDGLFHPQALIMNNSKPVHVWDAINEKYRFLTSDDAKLIRKKIGVAKTAFMMAENVGVLVTTKPGQNKLLSFMKIKDKYPNKKFYYLVNNSVNFDTLEDFPFIEVFVNTACERIAYDDYDKFRKPVLNFEDLPEN
jgi:2-(3-amino-3-carboxypropyl)histidine synthase